jgi:hypothetical protein
MVTAVQTARPATFSLKRPTPDWATVVLNRVRSGKATEIDLLWLNPEKVFKMRGLDPDPWQVKVAQEIRTQNSLLLLCSRQSGKSESDAALTLLTVLLTPPALILFLSKASRQAEELLAYKFMPMYLPWAKYAPMTTDNDCEKIFANGSRIVVLPDNEGTIRSFSSVNLIILDEASRVSDNLYHSVTPMLSVSRGRLVASSTAFGQRGWFYNEWIDKARAWKRFNVKGTDCRRLTRTFLEGERRKMGERWFAQEYCNDFAQAVGAVFSSEDIKNAFGRVSEEEAWLDLFGETMPLAPNVVEAETFDF